jgi:hypothetical protein
LGLRIQEQQKVLDPALVQALIERLPAQTRESALAGLQTLAAAAVELVAARAADRRQTEATA